MTVVVQTGMMESGVKGAQNAAVERCIHPVPSAMENVEERGDEM